MGPAFSGGVSMSVCIKCAREFPDGAPFCCWCGKRQQPEPRRALKRANGTGTVYKLSGRRKRPWVAARNRVVIGYYEYKKDALEALERLSGVQLSESYNMTFAQIYDLWSAEHFRDKSHGTAHNYRSAFRASAQLHARKFRELRTADFQAVIDASPELSASSLAIRKHLYTSMASWAIKNELITTNFASFVKLPKEEKKEKEIFTESDIAALEADGSNAAKIVLMLIYTGMRIGELFSLRVEDCHETYVVGGEKTNAGKNRIIPIRQEGRAYFAELLSNATGPLLISGYPQNRSVDHFRSREYYPLLQRLGIPKKTPHATRHTFASWAVAHGVPPEVLKKILGHTSYEITIGTYYHIAPESLVDALDEASTVSGLSVTET